MVVDASGRNTDRHTACKGPKMKSKTLSDLPDAIRSVATDGKKHAPLYLIGTNKLLLKPRCAELMDLLRAAPTTVVGGAHGTQREEHLGQSLLKRCRTIIQRVQLQQIIRTAASRRGRAARPSMTSFPPPCSITQRHAASTSTWCMSFRTWSTRLSWMQ